MADELLLTIRVHDPSEKTDASKSACWQTVKIDRASIDLPAATFAVKFIVPVLKQLKNLRVT